MANGYPEGKYTRVSCHPITSPSGNLGNGTGTYTESTKTFSCGDFHSIDLPEIGGIYNLSGMINGRTHNFPGWKCTHSGKTSDFKER